jgi:epoxyqueuosine reductase
MGHSTMTTATAATFEDRIRQRAATLGFDPVGITTLGPVESHGAFVEWLANGYAGEMGYLERGADKRRDTRLPFEGVRSAVVVGLNYGGKQPAGPIARYARGDDYHDIMVARLNELHRWLESGLDWQEHHARESPAGLVLLPWRPARGSRAAT